MPNVIEGNLYANPSDKFCIVVSRFNEFISSKLLSGALDSFIRLGVEESNIDVIWVPGSFEIPLMAKKAAQSKKYAAIVTLGAVIKGSSKGVAAVSLSEGIPVIFGILTTDNIEQAIERAGTKAGNKGADAAKSAIETANLISNLK